MAILAHAVGLSMGNTCQLPGLTSKVNGWVSQLEYATKVLSASPVIYDSRSTIHDLRFAIGRFCDQTIATFPRFATVLHNPPPLSTGCAQRGNGFELRRRRVRVQSLITDNHENSSRNLPTMRGLGMEAGSGSAGARRHTLRLPVAGAWRRHDRGGSHSKAI